MDRTLLIGLDGATWSVLDPLMETGVMPRLRALAARGARADLLSTPNPLTPPAWTSLVTGRTPGHHGIFDFVRSAESEGGLYFTLNTALDVRCETIWSAVGRMGGRVTSLNFPVAAPPRPVRGDVVPGFVPWRHLRRSVHPRELYDFLKTIPGFDAKALAMDMNEELKSIQWLPDEQHAPWIAHHVVRERQWLAIARALYAARPGDLTGVLFDGVDKLQHLFWRQLDPALAHTLATEKDRDVRARCLDYFSRLDEAIGDLVAAAGPEARVFFASDHGFGPTDAVFYANVFLEREGLLAWADGVEKDDWGRMATDRIKSHVIGIDWSRTSAYALTPSSNGIFIRRAAAPGRPGVPPSEYEAFRRRLAERLLAYVDPATGRRIVRRVMTREEAFPGAASGQAPDLTLVLDDFGFLSVLNANVVVRPRPQPAGTHRPHGIFLAAGPGIAAGRRIGTLSIVDVAPALMHSLGLPVPADWEGRVPAECFDADFMRARPVKIGARSVPPDGDAPEANADLMSAEDEAKVMDRLQALGYVE